MHKDEDDFDKATRLEDGKDWPPEDDCPGCPGRREGASAEYPHGGHKMSCSQTKNRIRFYWRSP